jgi:hypothetical protein
LSPNRINQEANREYPFTVRAWLHPAAKRTLEVLEGRLVMKPFGLVSLAFLFGAATLAAQNAGSWGVAGMENIFGSPQTQAFVIQPPTACPVSVQARQAASWNRMEVGNDRPKGSAQRLHVTLVSPNSTRIAKATVTVHGLTPRTRGYFSPLTFSDAPSDSAKTLNITFPDGPGKDVSTDLWVPGFSAAYSIDLIALTYADGSTWKHAYETCRTSIDGFMLIGGR